MIERSRKAEGEKKKRRPKVRPKDAHGKIPGQSLLPSFGDVQLQMGTIGARQAHQARLPDIKPVLLQLQSARAE